MTALNNANRVYEMLEASQEFDRHKQDYLVPVDGVTFTGSQETLVVEFPLGNLPGTTYSKVSDLATRQLATRFGKMPKSYQDNIMNGPGAGLMAENLNAWVRYIRSGGRVEVSADDRRRGDNNKKVLLRLYNGQVRAALSQVYRPVSNTFFLQAAADMVRQYEGRNDGPGGVSVVRSFVTPHSMELKIVVATGNSDRSNYGIGMGVFNDETGMGGIRVSSLLQRHSCTNSIVAEDTFSGRHVGNRMSDHVLQSLFVDAMTRAFSRAVGMLQVTPIFERIRVPNLADEIAKICAANNLSQNVVAATNRGTELDDSIMALFNGVSYAAHQQDGDERRQELETLAGNLFSKAQSILETVGESTFARRVQSAGLARMLVGK